MYSATRCLHSEVRDSSEVCGQVQWNQRCKSGVIWPVLGEVGSALSSVCRDRKRKMESDTYYQNENCNHEGESSTQDELSDRELRFGFGIWSVFALFGIPLSATCICIVAPGLMGYFQLLILGVDWTVAGYFRGFFTVQLGLQGAKSVCC